jgi:hypothetical protein
MERKNTNAYDRFKNTDLKKGIKLDSLLKREETYWIGAGAGAMLLVGIIDGGISVALAYGARKLYEKKNG